MKKLVLVLFLLSLALSCSAAITGSYPMGPGAPTLEHAVAVVSNYNLNVQEDQERQSFTFRFSLEQYVSLEAYAAKMSVGQPLSMDMSEADYLLFVAEPLKAKTIPDVKTGIYNYLLRTGSPFTTWTKIP